MSQLDRELDAWAMQHVGTAAANDLFDIIGRMIANEREACAKVADDMKEWARDTEWDAGVEHAKQAIAAAIRTRQGEGQS